MPAEYATLEIKVKTEALDRLKTQLDDLEKQIKRINQNPIGGGSSGSEYSPTIKNTSSKTVTDRSISIDLQSLNQLKKLTAQNDKILALIQQTLQRHNVPNTGSSGGAGSAFLGALAGRTFENQPTRKYQMPPMSGPIPDKVTERIGIWSPSAGKRQWFNANDHSPFDDLEDAPEDLIKKQYEKFARYAKRAKKFAFDFYKNEAGAFKSESGAVNLDVLGERFSQARRWLGPRLGRFFRGETTPETNEARRRMHGVVPSDFNIPAEQSGMSPAAIEALERKYAQRPKPFDASNYPEFHSPTESELAQFNSNPPSHVNMTASQAERIRKNQERIDAWRAMSGQPGNPHSSDPQLNIGTNPGSNPRPPSPTTPLGNFMRDESAALNIPWMRAKLNTIGGAVAGGAGRLASEFKTALVAVGFTATAVRSAHLAAPRDFEIMEGKFNALLAKVGMIFLPAVRQLGRGADAVGRGFDSIPQGLQNLAGDSVLPAVGIGAGLWAGGKLLGTKGGAMAGLGRAALAHPAISLPLVAGAATLGLGKIAQAASEGSGATKNPDGTYTLKQPEGWWARRMQDFGIGTNKILNWIGLGTPHDEFMSKQAWGGNRQPALPLRNAPRLHGITEAWGAFQQSFMPEGEMQLRMQQYKNAGMGPVSATGSNLNLLGPSVAAAIDNSASGLALKVIAANTANLGLS
jgi:hypothetical protein